MVAWVRIDCTRNNWAGNDRGYETTGYLKDKNGSSVAVVPPLHPPMRQSVLLKRALKYVPGPMLMKMGERSGRAKRMASKEITSVRGPCSSFPDAGSHSFAWLREK